MQKGIVHNPIFLRRCSFYTTHTAPVTRASANAAWAASQLGLETTVAPGTPVTRGATLCLREMLDTNTNVGGILTSLE
jgi:hypothetical protein